MTIEKLLSLFIEHAKTQHDVTLYPYQLEIADKVFGALIQNMLLTAYADEAHIKKLKTEEIPIELSRQSGKTTIICMVIEFILIYFPEAFGRQVRVGLTAPQDKQTKIDFDRLKALLRKTQPKFIITDALGEQVAKEESNAHNLVLPNQSSVAVFPMGSTSKIEGQSFDIILVEEAQDSNDPIMLQSVFPMGATTNAPHVLIGTAGTRICYFYRLVQSGRALVYKWREIVEQRRQTYKQDGNALHLVYEQYVLSQKELYGEDSDEFRRPYNLEWLIGTGQFTTSDALETIEDVDRKETHQEKASDTYVGIDVAKHPDSTVVTLLRFNQKKGVKEILNWLELRGENYQSQFEVITENLKRYKVVAIAIDSTGVGDPFTDLFISHTEWKDENSGLYGIKFTAVSKDNMYRNLKLSITESLTRLPNLSTKKGEKFKQQMLDLQQEYKGQLLSVRHPDDPNAHDDYPDSWALAEWAYARYNENTADISTVQIVDLQGEDIKRDDKGKIVDHWV